MRTYLINFAGEEDEAEEFEAEVQSAAVLLTVRVVENDDEPEVFEYRITPAGIEPLDA